MNGNGSSTPYVGLMTWEDVRTRLPATLRRAQPATRAIRFRIPRRGVYLGQPFVPCIAAIRMSATSGRENSCGGRSPLRSISRTFVPESEIRVSSP